MKKIKLGDYIDLLTDYHSGGSYKVLREKTKILQEPNYAVYVRTINFENDDFQTDLVYCDKESYDFLSYSHVAENDILMNKIANPGSVYIMPKVDFRATCGMNLFLIRLKNINQRYMFYMMKFHEAYIKGMTHGTTTKTITKDEVRGLIFNVHENMDDQNKVEHVLSSLDDKIALNKKMNQKLEAMAKRLYDYWFVQFDFPDKNGRPYKTTGGPMTYNPTLKREIPAGWEVSLVSDVIKPIDRGITYTSEEIKDSSGIPMINLACFDKKGNYRTGELKFYSGEYDESNKVDPLDILIACTDLTQKADIIGTPIFLSAEAPFYVFSTDLAKITPKNESHKYFLYYYLKNPTFHRYIKPFASGTTVKHLNVKGVENYPIFIPDEKVVKQFTETVRPMVIAINERINEINRLTALRDKLLPLLMNGQVVVN